jgi:phosphatidylserine decarboxylase
MENQGSCTFLYLKRPVLLRLDEELMKKSFFSQKIINSEDLNFLLTNRIPRIALTHLMGRLSKIKSPWFTIMAIWVWKRFTPLELEDTQNTGFQSIRDCFIRPLKPGRRVVDPNPQVLSSPCDGIVGEFGEVVEGQLFQAKGFGYTLDDLLGEHALNHHWRDGTYVTIRITSAMYHRFHAPYAGAVQHVRYFSGDTWNVNPIALRRVEKLFCKNERALLQYEICGGRHTLGLIPVAAVLVASIKLHGIEPLLSLNYQGPHEIPCQLSFDKGEEMGWFEHGSTILIFAPKGFQMLEGWSVGDRVRMGQGLMRLPKD